MLCLSYVFTIFTRGNFDLNLWCHQLDHYSIISISFASVQTLTNEFHSFTNKKSGLGKLLLCVWYNSLLLQRRNLPCALVTEFFPGRWHFLCHLCKTRCSIATQELKLQCILDAMQNTLPVFIFAQDHFLAIFFFF